MSDCLENKPAKLISSLLQSIESKAKEAQHLTPTINDVYDGFWALQLKLDRNDDNTQAILKALKEYQEHKQMERLIRQILHNLVVVKQESKKIQK